MLVCLLLTLSSIFLAGCAGNSPPYHQNYAANKTASLSAAHNAFGFSLFDRILQTQQDNSKNIMISPASIHLALSMVYAGSSGATQEEMGNALQVGNLKPNSLNQESQSLIRSLSRRNDVNLSIANSLWLNTARGFQFRQDYQNDMGKYYLASAQALNFDDEPASANMINGWVSENTNGKIKSIVSQGELPNYEAALINAVYFKGKWAEPFDKKLTQNRAFATSGNSQLQVPMMSQSGDYSYFEENGILGNHVLQAIKLPYGNASDPKERLNMYVFLPDRITDFAFLDENKWNELKSRFSRQKGTILLPKFKYEYEKELVPQLKELGMRTAFSGLADFSKMSEMAVQIGTVKHKTYIETNEEGSEAAAVTLIGMLTSAGPGYNPPKPFYMEVNKPFFYAIVDDGTGEILFMGVVNNPLAQ